MNILCIHGGLARALSKLGHEVLAPQVGPEPLLDVPALLAREGFAPDLILQQERLDHRVLLQGLEQVDCPKIYWSVDSHLNLFWQRYYLRLFDGVATPHPSLFKNLDDAPPVLGLAVSGFARPFEAFARRRHDIAFVGRISRARPLRGWLAEFLEQGYARHSPVLAQDLSWQEMMALYQDTCLAPNEAILGEVNFRLLEAASCGCLVLSPNVGEDQDALFLPGREIAVYDHVLELKALMDRYLAHPEKAEAVARAAWERVNREHLPIHRAEKLLTFAHGLTGSTVTGDRAATAMAMARYRLWRNNGLPGLDAQAMDAELAALSGAAEVTAARLGLMVQAGAKGKALELALAVLARDIHPDDAELNLAGSMTGIYADRWPLALQFFYRQARAERSSARPANPVELCLQWAALLTRRGMTMTPGSRHEAATMPPTTAEECLNLAGRLDPHDLDAARKLDALYARTKGYDYMRMGALSFLTLHARQKQPKNWRLGLGLGLVNLRAFRLQQGLEELVLALDIARKNDREQAFYRALDGMDPSGLTRAALKAATGQSSDTAPE